MSKLLHRGGVLRRELLSGLLEHRKQLAHPVDVRRAEFEDVYESYDRIAQAHSASRTAQTPRVPCRVGEDSTQNACQILPLHARNGLKSVSKLPHSFIDFWATLANPPTAVIWKTTSEVRYRILDRTSALVLMLRPVLVEKSGPMITPTAIVVTQYLRSNPKPPPPQSR